MLYFRPIIRGPERRPMPPITRASPGPNSEIAKFGLKITGFKVRSGGSEF